jgi:hypothetical protein
VRDETGPTHPVGKKQGGTNPLLDLLGALNALHVEGQNVELFKNLAKRRREKREATLRLMNSEAAAASEVASEKAHAAKSTRVGLDGLKEFIEAREDPDAARVPQNSKVLHEVLARWIAHCRRTRESIRAGGAAKLDQAVAPNANGQLRSVELVMNLKELEGICALLAVGVDDSGVIIDNHANRLSALFGCIDRVHDELAAALECGARARSIDPEFPSEEKRMRPDEAAYLENKAREAIEKRQRWLQVQAKVRELSRAHEWFAEAIRQATLDFDTLERRYSKMRTDWVKRRNAPGKQPPSAYTLLPAELARFSDEEYRTIALFRLGGVADHDNDRPIVPAHVGTGGAFERALALSMERVRLTPPEEPSSEGARLAEVLAPDHGAFTIEVAERMLAYVEKWVTGEIAKKGAGAATHRLEVRVNEEELRVFIGTKVFPLDNRDSARLLHAILKANGGWVAASKLCPKGQNFKRIKDNWPQEVQECLESKPGGGTRLRPHAVYRCNN